MQCTCRFLELVRLVVHGNKTDYKKLPSVRRHMIGASSGRFVSVTYYTLNIGICKDGKIHNFIGFILLNRLKMQKNRRFVIFLKKAIDKWRVKCYNTTEDKGLENKEEFRSHLITGVLRVNISIKDDRCIGCVRNFSVRIFYFIMEVQDY